MATFRMTCRRCGLQLVGRAELKDPSQVMSDAERRRSLITTFICDNCKPKPSKAAAKLLAKKPRTR